VRQVTLLANGRSSARRTTSAVVVGGVLGACLRWGIGELFGADSLQWSTLLVNVLGSLVLGWTVSVLGMATRNGFGQHLSLAAVGAGFCGSFTTFSTFSVIVAEHLRSGSLGAAVGYVALTVVLGIVAALVGRRSSAILSSPFTSVSPKNPPGSQR